MPSHSDKELRPQRAVRCNWAFKKRKQAAAQTRLLSAVMTNNTDLVQLLLAAGVCANTTDRQSRSALHIATSRGYMAIVRLLLAHHANPNQKDALQNTPLHLAACTSSMELITTLVRAGANVQELDQRGMNPVQLVEGKLSCAARMYREGDADATQYKDKLQKIAAMLTAVKEQEQTFDAIEALLLHKLEVSPSVANNGSAFDSQITELRSGIESFSIKE